MTRPPRLTVRNLEVVRDGRPVLSGVTFDLDAPGLIAVCGPNGAGKSTLLKALAGLLPAHGDISIDGERVTNLTTRTRARTIAYLPQDRTVHWNLPAAAVVDLGRVPHRAPHAAPSAKDRDAVHSAMLRMDAVPLMERAILSLSGGERARVLMARVLAQQAPVLLADEPAAGLDPAHQWGLFEALREEAARGTRVLVAMHDLALIDIFAAYVVLIDAAGRIATGPTRDVLTEARIAEVYRMSAQRVDGHLVVTGPFTPRSPSPSDLSH